MRDALPQRVIDAAMAEATETGWYELRLHRVAARAGVTLAELRTAYRDADAIADAWFAEALEAMLALPEAELADRPPSARVQAALMRWFEHQVAQRRTVGGILRAKMHLSHPHHWAPAIFNLSRLVHWALDVARVDARGLARQAEEVGTTAAFVAALAVFPGDDDTLTRTRAALRASLGFLDRLPRRD